MSSSREIIYKTLEFDKPERIGRHLWLLPWAQDHYPKEVAALQQQYPDDIISSPVFYKTPLKIQGDAYAVGTYVDEWGCEFENCQKGVIGEVKHPKLKDYQDLDTIQHPKERLSVDADQVNAFCKATDKFVVMPTFPRPFEQVQFFRGTENLMMDLALNEPGLTKLLGILHEFYLQEFEVWAKTNVDGLFMMDDWGTQRSLLISPAQWRHYFKPLYKEYVALAHRYGKKMFMHSDGFTLDIYPDLIEIGLDAFNSQIFCMGPDKLKAFAGKITFWGEIDRQYLLSQGTPEDVRKAVFEVYENLYRDGGVIAQFEFGAGAKPENAEAVFATWDEISHTKLQ